MVYTYRFERVDIRQTDYRDVVNAAALEGWRLVQVYVEQPAAVVVHVVVILERPTRA